MLPVKSRQSTLRALSRSPTTDAREMLRQTQFPTGIEASILEEALDSIGALERPLVGARSPQARLRQLHQGFDAGRTLKLIHALRDMALPSIRLRDAIEDAPFVEIPRPIEQKRGENNSDMTGDHQDIYVAEVVGDHEKWARRWLADRLDVDPEDCKQASGPVLENEFAPSRSASRPRKGQEVAKKQQAPKDKGQERN